MAAARDRAQLNGHDALLQRQARALGDPTRFQVFRYVANAGAPVRVAELTEHFGINHNAIRQHLAHLCAARLLVEEVATPTGSGRPPLQYRPSSEAAGRWDTSTPYERLAVSILEMKTQGRSAREVGVEAARKIRIPEPRTKAEALERLEAELTRWGFDPQRVVGAEAVELVLERCPFEAAASVAPEVVCQFHLGLADGLVELLGGRYEVTDLVARDPEEAGCRLRLLPLED